MPELLIEVGCEELPSSACREIVQQAPGLVSAALAAHGLTGEPVVWVAPRRFAVSVTGLPERQIYGLDLCTASNNGQFFSYRREKRSGRQASLIWITA